MTSLKGLTSTIFSIIAEIPFVFGVAFSRRSFQEKIVMTEFGFKPWQVNQVLKRLEKSRYLVNKNGKLGLTPKGAIRVNYCKLEKIKLTLQRKWDKKWRLIIFDIPETVRETRDALRSKLREWNCYRVQNSVFVYPFACEKEIAMINGILKIQPYVYVFLAQSLGTVEEKVRKHYQL